MYCIKCGLQIPEKSKFCPHCGEKQYEKDSLLSKKVPDENSENEFTRKIINTIKIVFSKEFVNKIVGWYLVWVLVHLWMLLVKTTYILPESYKYNNKRFFPFSSFRSNDYDIREFLVYTIFPIIILVIWFLL